MEEILSVLLGESVKESRDVIKERWNDSSSPFTSGLVIYGHHCYNICPGKIIACGKQSDGYAVSVLVNDTQLVRYTRLHTCDVENGQTLSVNDYIGSSKTSFMLEYCTSTESRWPVRICNLTFYKHNPEDIITDKLRVEYVEDASGWAAQITSTPNEECLEMLSNNKGD